MKLFKDKFERKIPKKNYYVVMIVSILVIVLTLYIRSFYINYKANQINNSVFNDKTINQMNTDDFDYIMAETPEALLFISYTGSNKVRNMEKRLYREIEKKNIADKIIYWNVTDIMNNHEYIDILRKKYPNFSEEIGKAPMLIYIKDGELVEVANSSNKMIDSKVLDEMLTKYGIV